MAEYTILLRNPRTLALLGELPVFLHARWRRHQREMSDFEITVNRNNVADSLIARNNVVEIRRDGEFEFAGIIRYREIGDPALGGQRGDVWKLSGPDLKWWLTNRLVDPGAAQYDSQVGVATETAMKHYVEDHLTAPADADRDVNTELAAGITFEVQPDASRGIDANFNGRFDNLLGGCLLPLARGADLLHDVVLLDDYSGYRYEVSEPTDATGTVTFSVGWDNVEKLIYREDYLGVRNSIYVLGQGAGAARTVEVVEDADGIVQDFRREGPIDARQADTVAKLQQIGNDRLESLLDDALSAHAVPAIIGPTLYRENWDVGYDVTVSISEVGIEMTRRIVEVIVQLNRDKGEDISISLGSRPKTQTRQLAEGQQRTNPVMHDGGGGAGGGYDTIEDEGGPLAQRTTIDFVGAGVTAADVAGETRVTIPGGGAPHNLLDGVTHPDTVAQAVSPGSLVYGDNTPDWNELLRSVPGGPALRNVLGLDQGDTVPAWKALLDAVNPANIAGAAAPGTSLLAAHRDHIHALLAGVATIDIEEDGGPLGAADTLDFTEGDAALVAFAAGKATLNMGLYALLAGRPGGVGQTLYGSPQIGDRLTLQSNSGGAVWAGGIHVPSDWFDFTDLGAPFLLTVLVGHTAIYARRGAMQVLMNLGGIAVETALGSAMGMPLGIGQMGGLAPSSTTWNNGGFGIMAELTNLGGAPAIGMDANGRRLRSTTSGAGAGATAGFYTTGAILQRQTQPTGLYKIKLGQTANCRYFAGWSDLSLAAMLAADSPGGSYVGVSYSTVRGDVNWQFIADNAGAGQTILDSGIPISTVARYIRLMNPQSTSWIVQLLDVILAALYGATFAPLQGPQAAINLRFMAGIEERAAGAVNCDFLHGWTLLGR